MSTEISGNWRLKENGQLHGQSFGHCAGCTLSLAEVRQNLTERDVWVFRGDGRSLLSYRAPTVVLLGSSRSLRSE